MEKQDSARDVQRDPRLREVVRAELEEARTAFHSLLHSLSEEDLRRKTVNPAWTIRDLLVHLIYWLGRTPQLLNDVRKGTGIRRLPPALFNWLNIWLTRLAARHQTLESIAAKYEAAYQATRAALASVRDDEWGNGATFIGSEHRTVEIIFRSHLQHVREHVAQIQQSLSRAEGDAGRRS